MAAASFNSNYECQNFSINCILSNSGFGCMDDPKNCSDKKIEANCEIKSMI